MNTIKKIFFVVVVFSMTVNIAQAQCNASNSPTFQVTTNQATLATNGVCGMQITIINADTNPVQGGALTFTVIAPSGTGLTPTTATVAGIYTVVVIDNSNSCETSQTVQVNVLPAPVISIAASNSLICSGHTLTLAASGASTYSWSTNAITANISIAPATTTTYSVIGTGSNACANTASIVINVNPLPSLTITASQNSVCVNEQVTLAASGANTYTWNTSQTGTNITVIPAATTIYTVYGSDGNGCEAGKQFTVSVSPCTSVEELKNEVFKIYPNPADNQLTINSKNEKENLIICIYDLTGRVVFSKQLRTENFRGIVPLDLLDNAYIATITNSQNQVFITKLLIAK